MKGIVIEFINHQVIKGPLKQLQLEPLEKQEGYNDYLLSKNAWKFE